MAENEFSNRRVIPIQASIPDVALPHVPSVRARSVSDYPGVSLGHRGVAQNYANPLLLGPPVCDELIGMTRAERAALGPMHEGRVDVIGGGAVVVQELAAALGDRAGIDELVVSEHDILDGIALSLL